MKVEDNCGAMFETGIAVVDDSTLSINYGVYMLAGFNCNCCFGLTYPVVIKDNKQREKLKYLVINGERETVVKLEPKQQKHK
jgi:hypothetical protein